jgi:hypothetical protein
MQVWMIGTWLRARAALEVRGEDGFVTAENIGYAVMAVIAAVALFGFITPLLGPRVWDWIQAEVFQGG